MALNLSGWHYCAPHTLCRPAFVWRGWRELWRWFDDQETDGDIYFNVQPAEPMTRDYPGCPAAVEDVIFVAHDVEIELTPAEVKDAEERAWEHLRALDEERDDGG